MFKISDRVRETSASTGTGSVVFNGSYGAYQTFGTGIGDGNTTYYTIENNDRWEVGQGTYTAISNSLSRDIVFDSSAGGAKITLEGISVVFCTLPASKAFVEDGSGDVIVSGVNASSGVFDDLYVYNTTQLYGPLLASGANVTNNLNVGGNLAVSGNFDYNGDLIVNEIIADSIVSSGFLTLVRPNGDEGNFFHAYKEDGTKQTLSLHVDSNISPQWKLGLKTNPSSETDPPTFAYVFGRDGLVGLLSNTDNYLILSDSVGLTAVNDSHTIFTVSSDDGALIDQRSTVNPALTVQGAPLNAADLQVWENSVGSPLSVVDSGGKFGILNGSPIYELDVDGSGRMETITLTSGVHFQDGTFQSSAFTGTDASAVSGWAAQTITNGDNAVSGWASSTFLTSDDDSIANFASGLAVQNELDIVTVSGLLGDSEVANFASGLAVQNETDIATVSGLLYDDTAISGYFETRVDTADSQISSVSGWAASTFLTSDDDSIANFASGLAVQNETEISSVSGYFETRSDTNAADIVTVSGLLGSAGSTSGIVFEKSGSNDEFRIGTTFIDADGTEQVVRATDFNGGFLRLEVARFSPSVSAAGQSRSWDQPVTQWTVTVDNPTDFTTNYVSGVKSPLTGITGSVTSDVTLYSTSGPSVTPGGGVDWTQTFSTDGDSPIYSSTNNLTGGSASATVSFLDKNQATISETATITFNWSNASNAISFGNLSGKNFLETYTSTSYNLTINNISDLSNTSTTITSSQGSLSNSSDDGTITFTTAIHKDNNSGRTITATTDFTRPATVTGTEYTVQDVSSDSSISATFTYPSFYIFTASTSNVPSRADVVDTNDFDSSTVTELGNQVKVIDQYINNPDGVPKCWWFGVRSSASQPTSFETGSGPSLLVSASPTEATVDLEPDSPPAGYNSEEYKLYGITLNPGNTYVKIS